MRIKIILVLTGLSLAPICLRAADEMSGTSFGYKRSEPSGKLVPWASYLAIRAGLLGLGLITARRLAFPPTSD